MLPAIQILEHRDLNTKEATAITERIKSKMGDLMSEVAKAFIGRAHAALGYESWDDYIKEEFGHAPLSLPRKERAAVSVLLRRQGMSTRAIGAATGVTHPTVLNDLAGGQNLPPGEESEVMPVTGLDGKNYTVTCTNPIPPEPVQQPAPAQTTTCPTCGGTGKVTQ